MDRWSRRQFVQGVGMAGLGLLAGCGLLPGQAERSARKPRVGYLGQGAAAGSTFVAPFQEGLREQGLVEGDNILIEYRWDDNVPERLPGLASELVAAQVDIIVAGGGPATHAAKSATATLP